jgi:hypothetical protein
MNSKIDHIDNLLNQFGYNQSSKCGFMFFMGGSMLTMSSEDEIDSLRTFQNQLAQIDINEEYEGLLGPLRDFYIQDFFEELIWRLDVEIETRKVTVPGTDITVSEFTFENNRMLKNDGSKIETLFDSESCLNAVFEGVGGELLSQNYDLTQSYKAGMCFFNLKMQVDTQCTIQIIQMVRKFLTPTLSSILMIARAQSVLFDGYSKIQLALRALISALDEEFSQTLWAFQSYVFYENQKEIPGIANLPIEEFIEHCRSRAIYFYNVNAEAIVHIANKQVHMTMFPSFQNESDERSSVKKAMQNIFGVPEKNTRHSDINLKALAIFSYFNVICETILSSSTESTIQ